MAEKKYNLIVTITSEETGDSTEVVYGQCPVSRLLAPDIIGTVMEHHLITHEGYAYPLNKDLLDGDRLEKPNSCTKS